MPIKDLQKKDKPGLSRAGVIRLGYKLRKCKKCKVNYPATGACPKCKSDKNFTTYTRNMEHFPVEFPTASDHFVLTDAPGVAEILGTDKPKELKIWFPFDDIDLVFPAYHQLWSAGSLICRGDAEQIIYAIDPQNGKAIIRDGVAIDDFVSKIPVGDDKTKDANFKIGQFMRCPGLEHDAYSRCATCKPNAMLIVLLRDVPRLAYYQIATTSKHNVSKITEELTFFKESVGQLRGIPFILKLEEREISAPTGDGGKRQRVKKHLLSLEVDPEYYQRLMATQYRLAAPERQVELLKSGDDEIIDEVAEVVTEKHAPNIGSIEPPMWTPPNGNDDSEFITDDWDLFKADILEKISFYRDEDHVADTMNELELAYDVSNEEYLFDQLARHASNQADQQIADETADMILGKEQPELPS